MKNYFSILTLLCIQTLAFAQKNDYSGFTDADAKTQQQWETRFDSLLKASDIDEFIKTLSAVPHHVGSPGDLSNVNFILNKYQSWGFDAHLDTFYCLFPTPKVRVLEEVSPNKFKAKLQEPALKEDATSSQTSQQLPTYNCYSADGDVTGDLVYVNQGIPADYEQLERMGIDVKGKIVIARYGGSWRGIKPKVAQEHGAIGCIIYSDPKDDGYYQGDVYPKGAFKNEYGVQRGSVLDMPTYAGDPLTPNTGARKNAQRIPRDSAKSLLKIPVLPISYADAKPLLEALSGPVAPESWRGALPITYHVGPGPVQVHLQLQFNWDIKPVYDVIAMMKGSTYPDEWILRGNHQDAWVNGANDPISGQAAMLAEAQAVGQLAKEGFKPKRTIVYCSWDGEEEGLLGSTEFAEDHAAELQQKAVVYINSDGNARGFLFAQGSHALQTFVNEVAGDVNDPQTGITVKERKIAQQATTAVSAKDQKDILDKNTMKLDALGSGSDYSSYIDHLGISALNIGFGGEDQGGEYHSIYDSYDMYRRFKDPKFEYGVALAKVGGRITMRLANADVLPFNFVDFYTTVNDYTNDLVKQTDDMRAQTEVTDELISNKFFAYASDPTKTYLPPKSKEPVPYVDFSPLQNALATLKQSIDRFDTLRKANPFPNTNVDHLNILLYQSERQLLLPNGLPNRPWYKHAIYAPGFYTGYGVKTLPGIREAMEQRKWDVMQQQMNETAKAITAYAQQIDAASKVLMMR